MRPVPHLERIIEKDNACGLILRTNFRPKESGMEALDKISSETDDSSHKLRRPGKLNNASELDNIVWPE
jgi:hypothetical protein